MENKKEWKGIWWLDVKSDKYLHGTLVYSPEEGAILEVIEYSEDLTKVFNHNNEFEIIHGISLTGTKLTLYNSFLMNNQFGFTGIISKKIKSNLVFEGIHFDDYSQLNFNKVEVSITNLGLWSSFSGFTKSITLDADNNFLNYKLKYEFPKSIDAIIDNGFNLSINSNVKFPMDFSNEVNLKENIYLIIKNDKPFSYQILYQLVSIFNNFISLGLNSSTFITSISAFSNDYMKELPGIKPFRQEIAILYQPNIFEYSKNIDQTNILFHYNSIKEQYQDLLSNWFAKYHQFESSLNLYFSTMSKTNEYLERRLINYCESFESLHRTLYGGRYIDHDKFLENLLPIFLRVIPNNLDTDFKESIKSKLSYLNDLSLKNRLKSFLIDNNDLFHTFVIPQV
jgi:hypothetical protein